NWDYRHCWLRDAYFVVNALNRLGATSTMERYLGYIVNVVAGSADGRLQPVYGLTGRAVPDEEAIDSLPGYRGMGPVRVGNQAYRQVQHDVYGAAILAATHVFFDRRLVRRGDEVLFRRLETLGDHAARLFDQPDAGLWELRGTPRVLQRDVLGRVRSPGQDRRASRAGRARRPLGRPGGPHPPGHLRPLLERDARQLRRHDGRRHAGREPAAPQRARLPVRRRSAFR